MPATGQILSYKPDWAEAQERFIAWWNHDEVDRLCLALNAPKADPGPLPPAPSREGMSPEDYYLNTEVRIAETERYMASRAWLGEAFPNAGYFLGPGSLALYLGSAPGYAWDTIWYEPWPPAEDGALPEYNAENPIWVWHQEMLRQGAEVARGRYRCGIPDLVEGLDIVASLRGSENLLFDLLDRPEWVHACQERLVDLYFRYYNRCYDLCKDDDGGVSTVFEVWGPGRIAKLQCDFSAMISPEMYAEFQLPYLRRLCQGLDYSLYHWDGPSAIPQLDNLLSIPELNAIQWSPGAGQNEVWHEEWYPHYRRILDAGKSLLLMGDYDRQGIDQVVKTFGTRGIYCYAWNVPSQQEGEDVLAYATRHWRG